MKKIITYLFICMVAIFAFNSLVSASDTELNITMLQFPSGSDENGAVFANAGGDAVLLESKGNYLLMDTFNPTSILDTALMHPIVKYLKDNNITRISVYLSHYHSDHYGGLKNLLLVDGITIERLYLPKTEYFCNYYDIDSNFTSPYFYKRFSDMNGEYRLGKVVSDNIPITYLWPDTNSIYTDESEDYRNCFGLVENSYSNKIQLGDATIDIIGPRGVLNLEDVIVDGLKITDYKTGTGKDIFHYNLTGSESNKLNLGNLKTSEDVPLTYDILGDYGNYYINNYSLVAMISVGNTKFFTAGDIGLN